MGIQVLTSEVFEKVAAEELLYGELLFNCNVAEEHLEYRMMNGFPFIYQPLARFHTSLLYRMRKELKWKWQNRIETETILPWNND